jgi:hypothetical protein
MDSKKTMVLILFFVLILFAGCEEIPSEKEIPGIHTEISIGEGQLLVKGAGIRRNIQNFYLMIYPADSYVFYEVILNITGVSENPIETQTWGEENIHLFDAVNQYTPVRSHRIIDQEEVDYKFGEKINFVFAYYFEVPIGSDYSAYQLSLNQDQVIPLASIVETPQPAPPFPTSELFAVVGGGSDNAASAYYTTVGGGQSNWASAAHATVGGGLKNTVENFFSTIGGGYTNTVKGRDSVVGGGSRNSIEGDRCMIGGGIGNTALESDGTIAGGAYNIVADNFGTVGGGTHNQSIGFASTISGGTGNTVSGDQANVNGGLNNRAEGSYSAVVGGYGNIASGNYSTIPGGAENSAAGDYSMASGYQGKIKPDHSGTFLFADSNQFPFFSISENEFAVRATGGVRFISELDSNGNPQAGVILQPGSGAWSMLSDRSKKTDITPVKPDEILNKLSQLEITSWRYQGQDASIRHIGPMAGDLYQIFGFGENDKTISTVDADGISLAALQGLYHIVLEQKESIESLQDEISTLETTLFLTWIALGISILSLITAGYVLTKISGQLPGKCKI